jgi:VanZ family protein
MEWVIWTSVAAFIALILFRLGAPERSHLLEYGLLTIFVHNALLERFRNSPRVQYWSAALTILSVTMVSLTDEGLQYYIPHRVSDIQDLIFNGMATISVIAGANLVRWLRSILLSKPSS